jgi:hypothetical protein
VLLNEKNIQIFVEAWRGGYGFLFRSEIFFRTTQELEYLFFLSRKAQFFFTDFNIRSYNKNSESNNFFFLHKNLNIFCVVRKKISERNKKP